MNTTKWIIGVVLASILTFVIVREKSIKKHELAEIAQKNTNIQVKKRYDENGNLKADVEIVDGKRNGIAHNYYKNGSIHSTIYYKNDKKDGLSTWYYENGKTYRETPFECNKKQGIQKTYYKSGKIMAEIPYKNNEIQPGTKEYLETGTLKKEYPTFNYKTINKTFPHKSIYIEVTGKKIKEITSFSAFYIDNGAKIVAKGGMENNTIRFAIPSIEGQLKQVEVTIWLVIKTQMNNKKILEKKIILDLGSI